MTKQEYYDLLVQSAYDGTFPSIKNTRCYYRLDQNADCRQRCAAGLLIPDGKYIREIENETATYLKVSGLITLPEGMDIFDLLDIQKIHDATACMRKWDAEEFLGMLNDLYCFDDIEKQRGKSHAV